MNVIDFANLGDLCAEKAPWSTPTTKNRCRAAIRNPRWTMLDNRFTHYRCNNTAKPGESFCWCHGGTRTQRRVRLSGYTPLGAALAHAARSMQTAEERFWEHLLDEIAP